MARRLIYVGPDDDVSELAGKVQAAAEGDEVALVVPAGAQAFQTQLNLRLLRSVGAKRGITTAVVSTDPRMQELAKSTGLPAYSSLAAYEGGIPVQLRQAAPSPLGGAPARHPVPIGPRVPAPVPPLDPDAPPRPQAPFMPRPGGPIAGASAAAPYGLTPRTPSIEDDPAAMGSPPFTGLRPARPEVAAGPWTASRTAATVAGAATAEALGTAPLPGPARSPLFEIPDSAEPVSPWDRRAQVPVADPAATAAFAPPPRTPPGGTPGRGGPEKPGPAAGRGSGARRPLAALYFAIAGVGVLALILFLLLGTSATVTVTVAEVPLTVSPTIQGTSDAIQAAQPDHILSKVVNYTANQQFQINPTGSQAVAAVAATGTVVLTPELSQQDCYQKGCSIPLTTQYEFETDTNPSEVFSVASFTTVTLGPGPVSSAPIHVVAAVAGTSGNVPAGAITQCPSADGDWCGADQIQASNPSATSGGVDASSQTVASASDISGWQTELSNTENQLSSDANTKLTAQAGAGYQFALDSNGDGKSITFAVTPSSFTTIAPNAVMSSEQVTVAMTAQATVYNPAGVQAVVVKDLNSSHNLPSGDALVPSQLTVSTPDVIQAASNGTFALSVTGIDYYKPSISFTALTKQITGRNPGDVPGIMAQQIPGATNVVVSETPVQLFFMPFFSSRIKIVETFVTPAPSTSATG